MQSDKLAVDPLHLNELRAERSATSAARTHLILAPAAQCRVMLWWMVSYRKRTQCLSIRILTFTFTTKLHASTVNNQKEIPHQPFMSFITAVLYLNSTFIILLCLRTSVFKFRSSSWLPIVDANSLFFCEKVTFIVTIMIISTVKIILTIVSIKWSR